MTEHDPRGGARYLSELTAEERAAVTASQGSGWAPGSPRWSDPVIEYRFLCFKLKTLPDGERTPEQDAQITEIVERCDALWRGFSRSQQARAEVPLSGRNDHATLRAFASACLADDAAPEAMQRAKRAQRFAQECDDDALRRVLASTPESAQQHADLAACASEAMRRGLKLGGGITDGI